MVLQQEYLFVFLFQENLDFANIMVLYVYILKATQLSLNNIF